MTATDAAPRTRVRQLPPNWFASVMGTGIVAVAAAGLPWQVPGLRGVARGMWVLAAALLVVLLVATARHWRQQPMTARSYHHDDVLMHFYGAPPMAFMTVGAGALLVGRDLVGMTVAVPLAWTLWGLGTITGIASAVVVPLRLARYRAADAFAGWLMPVVPPTVSASVGALLVPHTPAGPVRAAMLLACYVLLAGSVAMATVVIAAVIRRLVRRGPGPERIAPTWWIVLGPLGQSVTATCLLADAARGVLPADAVDALRDLALDWGVPVFVAAMVWLVVAVAVTRDAARTGLPFSLTWWSFTFPLGTCVTGAIGLAKHTGSAMLAGTAVALFTGLAVAWCVVAARTVRHRQTLVGAGPVSRAE